MSFCIDGYIKQDDDTLELVKLNPEELIGPYIKNKTVRNRIMKSCIYLVDNYFSNDEKVEKTKKELLFEFLEYGIKNWLLEGHDSNKEYIMELNANTTSLWTKHERYVLRSNGGVEKIPGDKVFVSHFEYEVEENKRSVDIMVMLEWKDGK